MGPSAYEPALVGTSTTSIAGLPSRNVSSDFSVGRRAFRLRLHHLKITRNIARRQARDVGPVARAAELERPRDGFTHTGFLRHDFRREFELTHGTAETAWPGRQRFHFERRRI